MEVFSKNIIVTWLLPYLPFLPTGRRSRVAPAKVASVILYKLKIGCQWRWLLVAVLFSGEPLTWQEVYYYFHRWSKQGAWKNMWLILLHLHRRLLDLSSIQLEGSHTPARNVGAAVGYQGRKAARSTNILFVADNQRLPLTMVTSQGGQHHTTFDLATVFVELCELLRAADLRLVGLFLNVDKAFDVNALRQDCARRDIEVNVPRNRRSTDWQTADDTLLIPELYQCRRVIEQLNAWLDSFKTLLVRFETCLHAWLAFHWLAFSVLLLGKISRQPSS